MGSSVRGCTTSVSKATTSEGKVWLTGEYTGGSGGVKPKVATGELAAILLSPSIASRSLMNATCSRSAVRLSSIALVLSLPSCLRNFCLSLSIARFRANCASLRTLLVFDEVDLGNVASGGDPDEEEVEKDMPESSYEKASRSERVRGGRIICKIVPSSEI